MKLYTLQMPPVPQLLSEQPAVYSKREYVARKYGESSPVFFNNYDWLVSRMPEFVPKPEAAEYPYWAFRDLYNIEGDTADEGFFALDIPLDELLLFDAADWTKIMQFSYIGTDARDEREFSRELQAYGVNSYKVMTTTFYPELRASITDSWSRLFRHNDEIKSGNYDCCTGGVQAAVWCLKQEWLR